MFKQRNILFFTVRLSQLVVFAAILAAGGLLVLSIGLFSAGTVGSSETGRLAIVIDDFGLQRRGVAEMLTLDCKLTVAIMPFLEHTEDDAEDALENGKEVIIHLPMQATFHDKPQHLGTRSIHISDSAEEIRSFMEDAIEELPEAVGANIHMGTVSSTREEVMRPVFESLQEKNMYFIDSKTSTKSICRELAQTVELPYYENQVFLEHEQKSRDYVKKRLRKAMKTAKENGECIAIGHVGYEGGMITVEAIREMLPELQKNGVELVFVSELTPLNGYAG